MPVIKLKIESCQECPKLKVEKVYTGDSWDDVQKWMCMAKNTRRGLKVITGYHEWRDKETVPKWCPLRYNKRAT